MMVWQVEVVGLTPLQLVLVGTALEVTIFLFEVPTGVVADVYSRRLSLIIGYVIMGVGFLLSGLYATFEATLLGSALWGLGYTFTSGALQAWFTDEVGVDQAGRAFIRSAQLGHIVGIVGALIATALGSLMLNLPMILGGLLYIALAIFLAFVMPEHGFKPAPREERNSFQQMGKTLLEGRRAVRGSTILLAIMGIGLFVGLYSEGYDRLNTAHLLSFELPILGGLQLPSVVWINLLGIILDQSAGDYRRLAGNRRAASGHESSSNRSRCGAGAGLLFHQRRDGRWLGGVCAGGQLCPGSLVPMGDRDHPQPDRTIGSQLDQPPDPIQRAGNRHFDARAGGCNHARAGGCNRADGRWAARRIGGGAPGGAGRALDQRRHPQPDDLVLSAAHPASA